MSIPLPAFRELGDGPPLMLINGYAASSADWDPQFVGCLSERFFVICPDNPGTGDSTLPDTHDPAIDTMAGDMARLLDSLDIGAVTVVGWSMGGFVAQRLALSEPPRVNGLVLLSTDPGGTSALRAPAEIWRRLTDRSGTAREQASRLISLLFPAEMATVVDRDFGDIVAEARARLSAATLEYQEAAMERWHGGTAIAPGKDAPPVLAASGSDDVVIPSGNVEILARLWPRCTTEIFDGGGHAFMAQEPDRLAATIADWVEANRERV